MVQQFRSITKKIKAIIRCQQLEEEAIRQQYEIGEVQFDLIISEKAIIQKVLDNLADLKVCLMNLFRSDICIEVLIESGIAKTLKYLQDYFKLYEADMGPDFKSLVTQCDQILKKWKNYVMTTIFDEAKDYSGEFQKYKFIKQAEKKLNHKNSSKQKSTSRMVTQSSAEIKEGIDLQPQQRSMLCKAFKKFEVDIGAGDSNEDARKDRSNSMGFAA